MKLAYNRMVEKRGGRRSRRRREDNIKINLK